MTTYNIEYNGVTVLERIPAEEVERNIQTLKGFLYLNGALTLKDISESITVRLNKSAGH